VSTSTVGPPIRSFSHHYREKFGSAVGKISVDMGQSCPNRARGGCIFCRPASFTPSYLKKSDEIFNQIEQGKKHLLKGRFKKHFAYFQQETCTAVENEELLPVLTSLLHDETCVGLILSTRPDYIGPRLLDLLAEQVTQSGKECLFELGLQTVHDHSLQLLNRNHSYDDFIRAVDLIHNAGCFQVGTHLIFGIPGETEKDMLDSLKTVCSLGINALKLHHLQVICDTPLHSMFLKGQIALFTLEEYIDFLLKAVPIIPADVVIHRLWATAHPNLLVAPKWNVLASDLSRVLREKMESLGFWQGQLAEDTFVSRG
jgi:radical SAM protein (TIGR01212 family)